MFLRNILGPVYEKIPLLATIPFWGDCRITNPLIIHTGLVARQQIGEVPSNVSPRMRWAIRYS